MPEAALLIPRPQGPKNKLLAEMDNLKMIKFFIECEPPTHTQQEHRVSRRKDGSVYFYEDRKLKEVRAFLSDQVAKMKPDKPMKGAIRLTVKWCFPGKGKPDGTYKFTKPDTDNLNKLLKDVMTDERYWKDDAQVASEIIEKFWADRSGIFIKVEEL